MKSVLIIIGDMFLGEDIAEILKIEGFNVIEETHLKNLSVIKKFLPDFILIDSDYHGINVTDVLNYLKSDGSTKNILPIFIVPPQNNEIIALIEKNGGLFLTKPFSVSDLLKFI
jgi:DNA-binding response OmpR family regulator